MSENLPAAVPASATSELVRFLEIALHDQTIPLEKLDHLIAIHRELRNDEQETEFNAAFARLQAKLPILDKTHTIEVKGKVRSKYTAYEDIHAAIQPLLEAERFTVTYGTRIESDTKITVIVSLQRDRIVRQTEVTLPLDKSEYRNVVQNYGATLTYCKRYALTLALNLVTKDQDDDAQSVSYITEDERTDLEMRMDAAGVMPGSAEESRFFSYCGVKTLGDITRGGHLQMAIAALERKRKQLAEKK